MSENQECVQLRGELQDIKDLKVQFDVALKESIQTGAVETVKTLKTQLEERARVLKEKLWPFEALSKEKVGQQYETQVNALRRAEVLKPLSSGELGIVDLAGIERPVPKLESVLSRMGEKREILTQKIEQGFSKVLIVPVGMKLDGLIDGYRKTILIHHEQGKLFDKAGEGLELDEATPVWVWDTYNQADVEGTLVYDVQEFSENHGGKLKAALVSETETTAFPGWRVVLMEDMLEVVQAGQGEEKASRPPLFAGDSPREYLEALGKEGPYVHEEGIYPEDFITLAITQLEETNQVLDEDTATYCTGAYFPAAESVPHGYWSRGTRQARLSGYTPDNRDEDFGARSAVRVT